MIMKALCAAVLVASIPSIGLSQDMADLSFGKQRDGVDAGLPGAAIDAVETSLN